MNYWILQHNPDILPVGTDYPSQVPNYLDYWRIRWYENKVQVDDQAFIWHSNSNKSKRGIYNVAKIVSVEPHSNDFKKYFSLMWDHDRFRYTRDALIRLEQYKSIIIERQYPNNFQLPISVDELKDAGFSAFPALHRPYQWGIRRLDPIEGVRLLKYIINTRT